MYLFIPANRLGKIPTDAEQATGLEKKEYDALAAGIEVLLQKIRLSTAAPET